MKFKIINENLIFNQKNIEKDVDKFISGENNILLITGFSGSGKSTLADKLSKQYNCNYFELDVLEFYLNGDITIEEVQKFEPGLYSFIIKNNVKSESLSNSEIQALYVQYIDYLINWCKSQSGQYIIEGLQIYEYFEFLNKEIFTDTSIIILGTSGLVSIIQGIKRNVNSGDSIMKQIPIIKWVLEDDPKLNSFKDFIKEQ